jgi:hypothetical protein
LEWEESASGLVLAAVVWAWVWEEPGLASGAVVCVSESVLAVAASACEVGSLASAAPVWQWVSAAPVWP